MQRFDPSRLDVLHVTQPTSAGVAKVVQQLIADQRRRGMAVGLASPNRPEFVTPLVDMGCHYFPWASVRSPFKGVYQESRGLKQIVTASDPRLLHLHSSKAGMIGRLAVRGRVPTVFQPNGWSFAAGEAWLKPISKQFELFAAQYWTTKTVCVSDLEVQAVQRRVSPEKIVVIANGLDLDEWDAKGHKSKHQARQLLGVPLNAKVAVCVGRVTKQKGPDLMLEIWRRLGGERSGYWLLWAGDGDLLDSVKAEAASVQRFRLDGPTTQPKTYFEAADVVVMPSRWEGHSLSMLEALATFRPVVAFDVEGMKETIIDGMGAVVPRNDVNAFANELGVWLEKPQAELEAAGVLARNRVAERYNLQRSCEEMVALYQSLWPQEVGPEGADKKSWSE